MKPGKVRLSTFLKNKKAIGYDDFHHIYSDVICEKDIQKGLNKINDKVFLQV